MARLDSGPLQLMQNSHSIDDNPLEVVATIFKNGGSFRKDYKPLLK